MPGAARQRGRAILARLALKLRAVSGLRDVALDLPGEPAPAPAAGAALADFRRRAAEALDDLREAVTTLEEVGPIARRVLGGAHPLALGIEETLQTARAALRGRA